MRLFKQSSSWNKFKSFVLLLQLLRTEVQLLFKEGVYRAPAVSWNVPHHQGDYNLMLKWSFNSINLKMEKVPGAYTEFPCSRFS